jgi:hypothetical protein
MKICIDYYLIITYVISMIFIIYLLYDKNNKKCSTFDGINKMNEINEMNEVDKMNEINKKNNMPANNIKKIMDFDRQMVNDNFIEPMNRPPIMSIYKIPEYPYTIFNNSPNIYPDDSIHQMGILNCDDDSEKYDILPLYGKKEYHNIYKYYTIINNSALKSNAFKIEIDHNKELYDGDKIVLNKLNNKTYTVSLYKIETFKYTPNNYKLFKNI